MCCVIALLLVIVVSASATCDQCCMLGTCSGAYSGSPGQCCGNVFGVNYCCPPTSSARCLAMTGRYACQAIAPSQPPMAIGAILGIVIGCFVLVAICACIWRRRHMQPVMQNTVYAPLPNANIVVSQQPGYPGYVAPAYAPPPMGYAQPVAYVPQGPTYVVNNVPRGYNNGYNDASNFAAGVVVGEALSGGFNHHHHHHFNGGYNNGGYSNGGFGGGDVFSASTGGGLAGGNVFSASSN